MDVSVGRGSRWLSRLRDSLKFLFAGTLDELEIALTKSAQGNVKQIIFYKPPVPWRFLCQKLKPASITNSCEISPLINKYLPGKESC